MKPKKHHLLTVAGAAQALPKNAPVSRFTNKLAPLQDLTAASRQHAKPTF